MGRGLQLNLQDYWVVLFLANTVLQWQGEHIDTKSPATVRILRGAQKH